MDKSSQLDWILAVHAVGKEPQYIKTEKAKAQMRALIAEVVNESLPERQELDPAKEIEEFKQSIGDLHPNSQEYQSKKTARALEAGSKAGANQAIDQLLANLEKTLEKL